MSFIPQVTCPHCNAAYSALRLRCPACGTSRVRRTNRTASTTAAAQKGTAAHADAAANARWQFIFGSVLTVAVILAVVILIHASISSTEAKKKAEEEALAAEIAAQEAAEREQAEKEAMQKAIEAAAAQVPEATEEPNITSISVTFLGSALSDNEFSAKVGDTVDLDAMTYPVETEATVTWSSTDESVCTVDQDGVVTIVGTGWGSVIAKCGSVAQEIKVLGR